MRRSLATALTLLSVPFAADRAWAADPAPEGATMTVNFKIAVKENAKSDYASSAIDRVLNAQCLMQAGQPMQVGFNGPTAEQEASANAAAAQAEALAQQAMPNMPSEDMVAMLEAEAEKCGEDEACMMAFAAKMQNNPEFMAQASQAASIGAAAKAAIPDLGPVRYQQWLPQSCSGTITANDSYVESDPGGEGGAGAYTDTVTVQGSGPIHSDWRGLVMETDLVAGTTTYRMQPPPPINLASNSSMNGAGQREIPPLGDTELPSILGPFQGVLGQQATEVKGRTGTISLEWQSVR